MVLVPVWSHQRVTRITGSESVVPDSASSSEQSSSGWALEAGMKPQFSSPCWSILSGSLRPSRGISASPSCDPSSSSVSDATYMLTLLSQILSSGSDSSEPPKLSTLWFQGGPGRAYSDSTSTLSASIAFGSRPNACLPS